MMYWIEMMLFLHLVFCTISLYDLFSDRTYSGKITMACLILFLPVFGVRIFDKQRKSQLRSPVTTPGYRHRFDMGRRNSLKPSMPSVNNP